MTDRSVLVLADGKAFEGKGFGALRSAENPLVGEVVFNTSMYGYQEIITDPSYAGQIMCFSYPHIGNVGCNALDNESDKIHVEGLVCRNLTEIPSNFRSEISLPDFLKEQGVMGLSGVDTRELVLHIRDNGSQMGAISTITSDDQIELLRAAALAAGSMAGKEYVSSVTVKQSYQWSQLPWSPESNSYPEVSKAELSSRPHCVVIDCGIKRNILRLLTLSGFRLTVVPALSSALEIKQLKPDAVFISNGPGDPATLSQLVTTVRELIGLAPIFGICLGHQVLAQALGATTYKLKFGHRGCNHPIQNMKDGKVEIATHNHGFAVAKEDLPDGVEITHMNLNDQTIAGIASTEAMAFSVQYHPEGSSGPHDSLYLFDQFYKSVVSQGAAAVTAQQLQSTLVGEKNA